MPEIKKYKVTEPFVHPQCSLGEAPFYESSSHSFRFFDVVKQHLHTIDLAAGPSSLKTIELPSSVGTSADIEGRPGQIAFGGKHGYGIFNRETEEYKIIKKFWNEQEEADGLPNRMRSNDGSVDCMGRFWVGTMNDQLVVEPGSDTGYIFRLDPDLTLHRVFSGVVIPNGISWSPDNKTMYMCDSPTKQVVAYDFEPITGSLTNKRVFYTITEPDGVPDGQAVDEEGYLWQAIHGAGKVIRISPDGELAAEIELPTRCVTCPRFVGESLFITSMADDELDRFPDSLKYQGALFKVDVGVRGREVYKFKLEKEI